MKNKQNRIFLCAGRTGGPLLPLDAIVQNISKSEIYVVGVSGGFEEGFSIKKQYKFLSLPETKLRILTFAKKNSLDVILGVLDTIGSLFLIGWAVLVSLWRIMKYKPNLILSAGGFSSVPVLVANWIAWIFGSRAKVVIHQQDPKVGLSNRIGVRFADLTSVVFDYTRKKFDRFEKAILIPNPIDTTRFSKKEYSDKHLGNFIGKNSKPILLVFGGGSGSLVINSWVRDNLDELTKKYRIVHILGVFQNKFEVASSTNYYPVVRLDEDMGLTMRDANKVICRAGIGSISELKYLRKGGYLIPLLNSHQELNAELAGEGFVTMSEDNKDNWLELLDGDMSSLINIDKKGKDQLFEYYKLVDGLLN